MKFTHRVRVNKITTHDVSVYECMIHLPLGSSQSHGLMSSSCSKPKLCPSSCAIVTAVAVGIVK